MQPGSGKSKTEYGRRQSQADGKIRTAGAFSILEVRMALMKHVFFAKKRQLFWNFYLVQKALGFRLLRIKEARQRFFAMDYTMSNCFLHGRCLF